MPQSVPLMYWRANDIRLVMQENILVLAVSGHDGQ